MRVINKTEFTAALLAAALALPMAAFAQTTTTPATAAKPPAVVSEATTTAPESSRQKKVEQRIADMHATLKITSAQEKQWDQFADVMLGNAQAMDSILTDNAGKEATQSAQAILQGYATITQLHAQNVQKLSAAFDTLYTALTPEQKKAADEMFRMKAEQHQQKQSG